MIEEKVQPIDLGDKEGSAIARNLRGLVKEMRPKEWVKNLLVFAGVIFSGTLLDAGNLLKSVEGFLLFCAASSGVYLFNDLCDLQEDRRHPVKARRPIASGMLDLNVARVALVALFSIAIAGSMLMSYGFAVILAAYIVTCLAYSLGLKSVVILDVIIIASGFVLRAVSGAVLIGVEASVWLVMCTSMVALLIAFGKRRHELVLLEDTAGDHRRNLNEYSVEFIDSLMSICAGAAVVTFALYTLSEETVARVGSHWMLLTLPYVIYGIFRYLFLIHRREEGGDPVQILYRDLPTIVNLLLWIATVGAVIYLPRMYPLN